MLAQGLGWGDASGSTFLCRGSRAGVQFRDESRYCPNQASGEAKFIASDQSFAKARLIDNATWQRVSAEREANLCGAVSRALTRNRFGTRFPLWDLAWGGLLGRQAIPHPRTNGIAVTLEEQPYRPIVAGRSWWAGTPRNLSFSAPSGGDPVMVPLGSQVSVGMQGKQRAGGTRGTSARVGPCGATLLRALASVLQSTGSWGWEEMSHARLSPDQGGGVAVLGLCRSVGHLDGAFTHYAGSKSIPPSCMDSNWAQQCSESQRLLPPRSLLRDEIPSFLPRVLGCTFPPTAVLPRWRPFT